jgi:hypothetical protein
MKSLVAMLESLPVPLNWEGGAWRRLHVAIPGAGAGARHFPVDVNERRVGGGCPVQIQTLGPRGSQKTERYCSRC